MADLDNKVSFKDKIKYIKDEPGDLKTKVSETYIWFTPVELQRFLRNPYVWVLNKKRWHDRPKKIGDKIMYHDEGPFTVVGFPEHDYAFVIDYKGEKITVQWECCDPVKG